MTKIPAPRPQRETPTYQTPQPETPATINSMAEAITTTLGPKTAYPSGRKGRGLPFWLNKELREKQIPKTETTVPEEEIWDLDGEK